MSVSSLSSVAPAVGAQAYVEAFESFTRDGVLVGPAWLSEVRSSAMARFERLGFPTMKNEDWHFTNVAPIAEAELTPIVSASGSVRREMLADLTFGRPDWPTLVFVNGRYDAELSTTQTFPAGVTVVPMARALVEPGLLSDGLLERHLTRIASFEDHPFTALNAALFADGAVVHVARDVAVATPIHLLFVVDANAAKSSMHTRNLIVLERNATATVLETFAGLGDASYMTNAVTEVSVEDGATLEHYKMQRESADAFHVGTVEAHQPGRDSHFISFSFATGGSLTRSNIYTSLQGDGCGATLNGVYMLDRAQHGDHQTRIEHVAPNCFSRELYKAVLDDDSHGVFNGKVYVHPEAQKTDGKQTNNTLLLSERARVDTKPQLEIYADDVKCTHGATIGRPDEVSTFYMRSRGVSAEMTRRLLTYAFAAEVLETIRVDEVREELERATLVRFAAELATAE
jgi:Fe-S cluster assembly protein SufD